MREKEITFKYIYDDFVKSFINNFYSSKIIILIIILTPILIGLVVALLILKDEPYTISFDEGIILFLICFLCTYLLTRPLQMIPAVYRKWQTTANNQQDITFAISDKGFVIRNLYGTQVLAWNYIFQVVELKNFFCIYINSLEYRILPKRVLKPDEVRTIREILFKNNRSKYHIRGFRLKKINHK